MEKQDQQKIDNVRKQIDELLDKNKLKIGYDVTFPIYRILPDEVQLALKILEKHTMKITFTLVNK